MSRLSRLAHNGILVDGIPRFWDISGSIGSRLREMDTGRIFLDFHTGYGSLPLGYNHPKMVERCSKWDVGVLANKVANSDIYTEEFYQFTQKFRETVMPEGFEHLFLIDGGALAVDNAIKSCLDFKTGGSLDDSFCAPFEIVHLECAFHGRSGYPLSITDSNPVKTGGFPKHNWTRLPNIPVEGDPHLEVSVALDTCFDLISKRKHHIAGLIMEGGIQCEGGDRYIDSDFAKGLASICRDFRIPLIVDEVQTGFWSTGEVWGYQDLGIEPDIVAFGKKSQQCGITAGGLFLEYENNALSRSGRLNSTWGGNIVDMLRSVAVMEIVEEDGLDQNVKNMASLFTNRMHKIGLGENSRAKGVLMAFDLESSIKRDRFVELAAAEGLLCLPAGENTVRFRPSLAVTYEEMDEALDIIDRVLLKKFDE